MVWELLGYGTDSRYSDDVRYREYTTSKRTAELFEQVPRIQFTDSGHGIVFSARVHRGARKPTRRMEHVEKHMARLRAEAKPAQRQPSALRAERDRYREALERIAEQGAALAPGWRHWAQIARNALDRDGA